MNVPREYTQENKIIGPNVRRLMILVMARQAIPPGGGIAEGVEAILHLDRHARAALEWIEDALYAIKSAPDNPYGEDDEVIVADLLRQIEEKNRP